MTNESVSPAQLALAVRVSAGFDLEARFEQLVAQVLIDLRRTLHVPEGNGAHGPDPLVEAEFARARARLLLFRDEYVALWTELAKLDERTLSELDQVLQDSRVRLLLAVERRCSSEIAGSVRALAGRMKDTVLYESPEGVDR